jgi:ADP-glucose pyrophosphorylase
MRLNLRDNQGAMMIMLTKSMMEAAVAVAVHPKLIDFGKDLFNTLCSDASELHGQTNTLREPIMADSECSHTKLSF